MAAHLIIDAVSERLLLPTQQADGIKVPRKWASVVLKSKNRGRTHEQHDLVSD